MWSDAFNSIIQGDFLLGLFQVLMAIVITVANIALYPIGFIIHGAMPQIDNMLGVLADYFDLAATYMAWVIDAFAIPVEVVTMISTYFLFKFTVSFSLWTFKLVLQWKRTIWG